MESYAPSKQSRPDGAITLELRSTAFRRLSGILLIFASLRLYFHSKMHTLQVYCFTNSCSLKISFFLYLTHTCSLDLSIHLFTSPPPSRTDTSTMQHKCLCFLFGCLLFVVFHVQSLHTRYTWGKRTTIIIKISRRR